MESLNLTERLTIMTTPEIKEALRKESRETLKPIGLIARDLIMSGLLRGKKDADEHSQK